MASRNSKKLILLENEYQAKNFLENFEKFKNFMPITFDFKTEQILKDKKINFKMEEEYEKEGIYKNIHHESLKATWEICDKLKIYYRDIEIFPLFYYDIYTYIAAFKKDLRILKEIIKKESPGEIVAYESKEGKNDFFLEIIKNIFDGKIKVENYTSEKKKDIREKNYIKIAAKMQNILTRIRLNLSRNKNKIFVSGGEPYFGNLTKELLKNKKNRVFNFSGKLSRSFFVGLNYLPFYEFKGIKFSEEELKKDAIDLEKNIDKNFSKIYGIETEIENSIKKKLISIVNTNSEVFSKLEEFYSFIKDEKIDLIITSEESDPLSRGIIQIANKFNVPTMIFQHGLFMSEIATYSNADYVFSIEEKQKDLYLKSSSKKTKVNVMGIPRYDSFKKTEKQRKEKIILYIMEVSRKLDMVPETHLTKKQQKEILRIIFNVMKKFKDYKLIVKTRPGWEMAGLPESIAKEQNFKNAEFIEKTDNNQLLNDSDLIIVNFSSMGYEALLLKKPVISLSYKNVKKFNPYEKIEVVEKVYTEKELYDSIVKNLKKGGYREEGLEKYFEVNKNSSQDISNFINKVLNMYKRR